MPMSDDLTRYRAAIRDHYLMSEATLMSRLLGEADIGEKVRAAAQSEAAAFVTAARTNATRSGLIDKFLQEYGLSTAEGVTLMRLAEALLRTPDATTADALIADKVEAGDWAAHRGKSPFPLVNFSTRALMLTAAWLDDVEAKDPARAIVAGTKKLLDRVGEPVIRASVAQAMKIMGEHFVLGETIAEAQRRGEKFARQGYTFSYDMLGEAALTAEDAARYFDDYADAIAAISKTATSHDPRENAGISIKLSALHPRYEYSQKKRVLSELRSRILRLAVAAKEGGIGLNIDAEEADRLDLSLDLIEALMRDPALAGWKGFGVVVQAYQRRATPVIDWLAALARETGRPVMVRLVKGAYWDAEIKRAQVLGLDSYPVFTRKICTDVSFIACARRLLANADVFYPQFATHNALTAATVRQMAQDAQAYELQRLHGMGEALHDSLLEAGARSRIYAPVGGHKELLPYLVRRLLENGANSSFVNQLIDPDLSIDDIVSDPVAELNAAPTKHNPEIPSPRDLFAGARLSAQGYDDTDPPTATALLSSMRAPDEIHAHRLPGAAPSGRAGAVKNPANGETIGTVTNASADDVAQAFKKATAAAGDWRDMDAKARASILRRAADLLEARTHRFVGIACREAGKTMQDGIAEVREAVDFLRYYASEAERLDPRDPHLVVACISPWNFPLAIFLGQISGALAAGAAVVAKPAEQTPLIAFEAIKLLYEAGAPEDVIHFLPGDGPGVGASIVSHPDVGGVVFTGSTQTARAIRRQLVETGNEDATFIAETGGLNAMIIDSTALLEQAVSDVVSSAFQSAGQRCSACRVVCVQSDIADRFMQMLKGAVAELKIGDPALHETDVGPVIDEDARETILSYLKNETDPSTIFVCDGQDVAGPGCFVQPTIVELPSFDSLSKEVFGPVLHVVRFEAKDLQTTIERVNALGFGLTMGVHTRIDETMHDIVARARTGNIYVNRNQIGAVVGVQPFGGEGLSGTGPKAGGPHYVEAMTRKSNRADLPEIDISETGDSVSLNAVVDRAGTAFTQWHARQDKVSVLRAASEIEGKARETLRRAAEMRIRYFEATTDLPGPTGESNTLRLKGRGVIAALGGGEDLAMSQYATILASGAALVCEEDAASALQEALEKSGAPTDLVVGLALPMLRSKPLIAAPGLTALVCDAGPLSCRTINEVLAARDGALVPLLSATDPPWRFAVERTVTVNTTAAGGDVRLLSLQS